MQVLRLGTSTLTEHPFKNNGFGVTWNDLKKDENMSISANVETWDQDIFGRGLSGEITADIKLTSDLDVFLNAGYKTEGYVLGKQISAGENLGIGLLYFVNQ